jgi:hypothetical protein
MVSERVVGGVFGLADPVPESAGSALVPDGPNVSFLATARSAIRLFVLETLPAVVWMPSYLCPSALDALKGLDCTLRFYPVDGDLNVDPAGTWWDELQDDDVVCFIDFFGRLADRALFDRARERGALVLEDASQAMLTVGVGEGADACVFSPRKLVGVPEGGVLVRAVAPVRSVPFDRAPDEWRRVQLGAAVARRDFDVRGGCDADRTWYTLFTGAEDAPVGVFPMSTFTRSMLLGSFDRDAIAAARVANWRALAARLGPLSLFDPAVMEEEFERGVVPIGFLVRFDSRLERSLAFARFIQGKIYPPTHWGKLVDVLPPEFEASRDLSERVLTLPCDQRYGPAEMERIVLCVEAALGADDPRILPA